MQDPVPVLYTSEHTGESYDVVVVGPSAIDPSLVKVKRCYDGRSLTVARSALA